MQAVKCVVVGDIGVGKSCAISAAVNKVFPDSVPTVIDYPQMNIMIGGKPINFILWDTNCSEDYERLRPLSYPQTDVFLIMFSVASRDSLERVRSKWYPDIHHHCPSTPFILVGTKTDLRGDDSDHDGKFVSKMQGEQIAREVGAVKYLECSALAMKGLDVVFESAIRCVCGPPPGFYSKEKSCLLM